MANRPFAVGDLVIHNDGGCGVVTEVKTSSISVLFITIQQEYSILKTNIKTIRTPRKGSQEARDIVAMLASEYRKALARKKDDNESEFKRGARCKDKFSKHIIYRKAKSMLK